MAKKRKKEKLKKTRKKAIKKISKKSTQKEDKFVSGFEEVIIRCPSCGKEFRMIKSSEFNAEGMLCQRCAAGGGIGFEEDTD